MENQLLTEIEDFARKTGMKESVVCRLAIGNAKLHARMKEGGACNIRTAHRLRLWMREWANNPQSHQSEGRVMDSATLSRKRRKEVSQ